MVNYENVYISDTKMVNYENVIYPVTVELSFFGDINVTYRNN